MTITFLILAVFVIVALVALLDEVDKDITGVLDGKAINNELGVGIGIDVLFATADAIAVESGFIIIVLDVTAEDEDKPPVLWKRDSKKVLLLFAPTKPVSFLNGLPRFLIGGGVNLLFSLLML